MRRTTSSPADSRSCSCSRLCPVPGAGGLFAFLYAWNEFITPLFLINDSAKYPLALAFANLRGGTSGANLGVTEAGVVVMATPCLILFLLLQRYYVRGILSGALNR